MRKDAWWRVRPAPRPAPSARAGSVAAMSLWTPGGEVPVERSKPGQPASGGPGPVDDGAAGYVGGPSLDDLSPEERAQAEEMIRQMAEVQRQLAGTPAAQLVANHAMGLYEVAAIKLSQEPPMLAEAKVAIDALVAIMDAVGDRLGEDNAPLQQAMSQLQLAFVELKSRGDAG